MDRSVLDEVVAAIEPIEGGLGEAARRRLDERAGAGALGALAELAARLAAARRRLPPPVERKVVIAAASGAGGDRPLCAAAAGGAPVTVLARAAGARLVLVDAGVAGGADQDLGPGILQLRAGDGGDDGFTAAQGVVALQTGIALVLSLASDGVDVLAAADLSPGAPAAARRLEDALAAGAEPTAALAAAGGFAQGALAGACLAAAAIRVPLLADGAGARAATRLAAALAPAAAGYLLAPPADLGLRADDGGGAALALLHVDAAARLLRELLPPTA